jgi:hypothetical protein
MRGDTAKFPVCLAEEIQKDVHQLERCVAEGLIEVGYALLLDEGGFWRTRRTPPQGDPPAMGHGHGHADGAGPLHHSDRRGTSMTLLEGPLVP